MSASCMTTIKIKKINKRNIYTYIYMQKNTSRQGIVDALHISLSTVIQNLKLLEEEGLIYRAGFCESTGGRKAYDIRIVENARISLGIGILKNQIQLVAIDLYGSLVKKSIQNLTFHADDAYYRQLGKAVSDFIQQGKWKAERLLGAGIAIQGITNEEGTSVSYGPILANSGLLLRELARYIPCQSYLIHDSKAAALAELWCHKDIRNASVLLLNQNFGGAMIKDRRLHYGQNLHGGLLEHISIDPNGPVCYCGSHGCLETYCSADSLAKAAGTDLDQFFQGLRKDDLTARKIWSQYLNRLAFAIRNLQIIMDSPVIVSGLLTSYMTKEDFGDLHQQINAQSSFPFPCEFLLPGQHGPLAPAIGSALYFVDQWLQQV